MEASSRINKIRRVFHKQKNMKKCYFCGSVTHVLNICEMRDIIARYKWFDRTRKVHSHHKQSSNKQDEQSVESDVDMSVSNTKTSS